MKEMLATVQRTMKRGEMVFEQLSSMQDSVMLELSMALSIYGVQPVGLD